MKIKFLLLVVFALIVLFVWLERFFPSKKHNIFLPQRLLRSINDYFFKKSSAQTSHNLSSWKDSALIIIVLGTALIFIIYDSFR